MAGHLLLVIFMCLFLQLKAQALLPPALTVDPAEITEKDSVTMNCQPPSSVSVPECYFHIMRGQPAKKLPCLHTLTGTELLTMSHQSSPAEVKITCFYLNAAQSPESVMSSIIIRTSIPPKLTVNPPVITQTDLVTVNCQPPPVSVSKCYFHTSSRAITLSCLQTLTGTELLKMTHQGSPAEVKLTCFYVSKLGDNDYPSPHSATSSITILSQKPQLSLHHSDGEYVLFTCSLPVSANHDTRCHLYFGEASRPVETTTIMSLTDQKNQSFCQFTVKILYFLSQLRAVQQSDASCDYTLGGKPGSLSPRSDGYSLTHILEKESSRSPTMNAFTVNTGQNTDRPASTTITLTKQTSGLTVSTISNVGSFVSTFPTSVKPPSGVSVSNPDTEENTFPEIPLKTTSAGMWIWKFVAIAAGCGVTVGVMFLVSAALCNRRRAGSEEQKRRESESHYYTTISDEAAVTAQKDMVYSTVEAH